MEYSTSGSFVCQNSRFNNMPLPSARCVEDQQDSSSEYDSLPDISVVDVFDLASDVGNELEKIISIHGNELVQGLMQKVIRV